MDFVQLEMFVATAESRGVQRAAGLVHRTQPAVSMALRKLEAEVGAPLFDRANRGAYTLTAAGELLYARAKKLLAMRDDAFADIRELHELERGRVRIGANESAGHYLLPRLIEAFRTRHSRIHVDVTRQNSSQLIRDLRENMIDLALIAFAPEEKDVEAAPLMNDELILIASPDHPLARAKSVDLRSLGAESFIAHTVSSPSRSRVVDAFRASATPLNIVMEVAMIETIKKLIAMNLGIGFVPEMCAHDEIERGELVRIGLVGFQYQRTIWLARRRTDAHPPAADAFAALAISSSPLGGSSRFADASQRPA
ncbi:MAG TPA: LysR family transcriptional regulator [Terriglobia bacterium]|nr:LysR family transcriptional regulator [Terriglobia bacterium]